MSNSIKDKLHEVYEEEHSKPKTPIKISAMIDGELFEYVVPVEDIEGNVVIGVEEKDNGNGEVTTKTHIHMTAPPVVFPKLKTGGVQQIDVEISSTQEDDEVLLHKLYSAVREKDV